MVPVDLCLVAYLAERWLFLHHFLAALSSIDPALHEAAVMDGATKVQRMRHIDIPGIMPIAVILLILNTGQLLETGFEKYC